MRKIGEGAFSNVFLGTEVETGGKVAIKAHKPGLIEIDKANELREVVILKRSHHPCIVSLQDICTVGEEFFMVFEHMEANLYEKYLSEKFDRPV